METQNTSLLFRTTLTIVATMYPACELGTTSFGLVSRPSISTSTWQHVPVGNGLWHHSIVCSMHSQDSVATKILQESSMPTLGPTPASNLQIMPASILGSSSADESLRVPSVVQEIQHDLAPSRFVERTQDKMSSVVMSSPLVPSCTDLAMTKAAGVLKSQDMTLPALFCPTLMTSKSRCFEGMAPRCTRRCVQTLLSNITPHRCCFQNVLRDGRPLFPPQRKSLQFEPVGKGLRSR